MDSFNQLLADLDAANAQLSDAADNLKAARLAFLGTPETAQPADIDDDTRPPHWSDVAARIRAAVTMKTHTPRGAHVTDESESTDDL